MSKMLWNWYIKLYAKISVINRIYHGWLDLSTGKQSLTATARREVTPTGSGGQGVLCTRPNRCPMTWQEKSPRTAAGFSFPENLMLPGYGQPAVTTTISGGWIVRQGRRQVKAEVRECTVYSTEFESDGLTRDRPRIAAGVFFAVFFSLKRKRAWILPRKGVL